MTGLRSHSCTWRDSEGGCTYWHLRSGWDHSHGALSTPSQWKKAVVVETCGACMETCCLLCQSYVCCSCHCRICLCIFRMHCKTPCCTYLVVPSPWESACHSEMMISCCWWNQEGPWVRKPQGTCHWSWEAPPPY